MREARDWVRFHRELCKGDKRGIPRALRFVYLEVSLECRPKRGYIVLTPMMGDTEALHDLLGGDRGEVTRAFRFFTSTNPPMWRVESDSGERRLYVHEWPKWNPVDGTGSERQQRKRDSDRYDPPKSSRSDNGQCNEEVTAASGIVTDTSARGRVSLLSSPSYSSLPTKQIQDLGVGSTGPSEVAPDGERYVRLTDAITAELTASAQMATVQDIPAAWAKFTGHYADKWVHVAGRWQLWCVNEAKRERTDRERDREMAQRRGQAAPGAPNANQYDGPAIRAERKRREADYDETRRNAAPAPVGDLMAALDAKRPGPRPGSAPSDERPSEVRQKVASVPPPAMGKPELARVLTDEELTEKRRTEQQRLAEFEEQERAKAS